MPVSAKQPYQYHYSAFGIEAATEMELAAPVDRQLTLRHRDSSLTLFIGAPNDPESVIAAADRLIDALGQIRLAAIVALPEAVAS